MSDFCLFAFELFVEKVNFYCQTSYYPAVSFRLVDFPSVIIYQNITNSKDLDTSDNILIFRKGKSCLFKYGFKQFENTIEKVPLYIMLVDFKEEKPKLLGSCSIPMLSIIHQIKLQNKDLEVPCTGQETGIFKLFNLMSTIIGSITVRIKLTCFGKSLLQHVNVGGKERAKIDVLLRLNENVDESKKCNSHFELEPDHIVLPPSGTKDSKNKGRKEKHRKHYLHDKAIQCRSHKKEQSGGNDKHKVESVTTDLTNGDIFCPPPLFLNLNIEENRKTTKHFPEKKNGTFLLKNQYTEYDDISSDEEPFKEILKPQGNNHRKYKIDSWNFSKGKISSHKTPTRNGSKNYSEELQSVRNVSDLPILTSLLEEILILVGTNNSLISKRFSGNADLHQETQIKQRLQESIEVDNVENKEKISKIHNTQQIIDSKKSTEQHEPVRPENKVMKVSRKAQSRKKKTVNYGLTRTQKMRYKMTHPNDAFPKEGRDLHRKHVYKTPISKQCSVNEYEDMDDAKITFPSEGLVTKDGLKSKAGTEIYEEAKQDKDSHEHRQPNNINVVLPSPNDLDESGLDDAEKTHSTGSSMTDIKRVENQMGFYSPEEQRRITTSALGKFEDTEPWSSKDIDKIDDYSSDSFGSHADKDSVMSGTSSVSIPNAYQATEQSKTDSFINRSASVLSSPRRSKIKLRSPMEKVSDTELSLSRQSQDSRSPPERYSSRLSSREESPFKSKFSPVKSKTFSKKELSNKNSNKGRSISTLSSYSYSNLSDVSGEP